ncbi:hypothetical protein AVEN_175729-1 [Araneus ventricosus]|uniref:Uncharacterized protein n=1 Tax=Araneus ventricosus TaxID=182803 RepID=A0A4Y2FGY9_ARAVE|nr:hypothetical protein AVEN_175729-1 [Araneus ventricosus]
MLRSYLLCHATMDCETGANCNNVVILSANLSSHSSMNFYLFPNPAKRRQPSEHILNDPDYPSCYNLLRFLYQQIYSTACMPERPKTEGNNPNGLGTSRMRASPSEYSNQRTKESAFITEKNPPVKNAKT